MLYNSCTRCQNICVLYTTCTYFINDALTLPICFIFFLITSVCRWTSLHVAGGGEDEVLWLVDLQRCGAFPNIHRGFLDHAKYSVSSQAPSLVLALYTVVSYSFYNVLPKYFIFVCCRFLYENKYDVNTQSVTKYNNNL